MLAVSRSQQIFLGVVVLIGAVILYFWLQPKVQRSLAPTPKVAWVGIEASGSGIAEVGLVEIEAGESFRLHAVLEAETRAGETIYYTEAGAVRILGVLIDPEKLRPWDQLDDAKVLWFTVEGSSRYVELADGEVLDGLRFDEFFHPEWSTRWSVNGSLTPRFDHQIADELEGRIAFGTQRYQAWIEIFDPANSFLPKARFKSWGADRVLADADHFPTVIAILPDAPVASSVFGLSQVELPADPDRTLLEDAARRSSQRVLFTRIILLRDILQNSGEPENLDWQRADLAAGPKWPSEIGPGDLVQVGARWVVLFQDGGRVGVLDADDLCFDFEKGAVIRRLGDIFGGEGEVEWASL